MSDTSNSEQATTAQSPFSGGGQRGTGSFAQIRLAVLLVILVVVASALGYDRLVARAGYVRATKVLDRIIQGGEDPAASAESMVMATDGKAEKGGKGLTEDPSKADGKSKQESSNNENTASIELPEESIDGEDDGKEVEESKPESKTKKGPIVYGRADIQKALGVRPVDDGKASEAPKKLPSRLVSQTDPKMWANKHGHWELYRWRRGLPFKYYELIVIYSGPNEPLFANYVGDKPLEPSMFSGVAIPIFDEDAPPEGHAPVAAGMDASGGKKGGKKRGGKKGHDHSHSHGGDKKAAPEKTAPKKDAPEKAEPKKTEEGKAKDGEKKG